MIDAHPALKAASPQAPVTDWFVGDDFHHNGALFLPHAFRLLADFGEPRPEPMPRRRTTSTTDAATATTSSSTWARCPTSTSTYFKGDIAFWNDLMTHPTYDAFWKARNIRAAPRRTSSPPS